MLDGRSALQLQIRAPSSLSSHVKPDLQLPDFCISRQFFPPIQAHLRSRCGVAKQLKVAQASEIASNVAATIANARRAARISPSIFKDESNSESFRHSWRLLVLSASRQLGCPRFFVCVGKKPAEWTVIGRLGWMRLFVVNIFSRSRLFARNLFLLLRLCHLGCLSRL
jgi:hypothetical protein